ncbi:glycosyl transferase [Vibrio breoganii]|uniref:glycosyltransferase n=1 Tax=Vibrio breoganii TaxID=553239 RepID=UPI000C84D35B|nr:glycosyltransferase [Vibrio breoganii]PMO90155.1 glycosyl transferase [Vibrio breoganii]
MNDVKIAVAMSVYKNDRLSNIEKAISSVLLQTYTNFTFFIEIDGTVSNEVTEYFENLVTLDDRVVTNFNKENRGLAFRLNSIIDMVVELDCYKYLVRMDADDICLVNRFEKQIDFMLSNINVSVSGTDVIEIDCNDNHVFYKKMYSDHDIIKNNVIKRCPFNHPTVIMDTSIFRDGKIRYKSHLNNTQDYYLWVDLLSADKQFANLNEALLLFRVDSNFHERRGFSKAANDFKSRLYAFKKLDLYSFSNIMHAIFLFFLRLSPVRLKEWAYKTLR